MPPTGHVVGVGRIAFDILGVVPRFPEPDSRSNLSEVSIQGAGEVATALATVCALGLPAFCVGSVGGDAFGRFALDLLAGDGVNVSHVKLTEAQLSPFSFIAVSKGGQTLASSDSGRVSLHTRAAFTTEGDAQAPQPGDLDLGILAGARLLLLDGTFVPAQRLAAGRARELGVPVVLDVTAAEPGIMELCALADHLICSERFAIEVTHKGELEDALTALTALGPKSAVITLGHAGSMGKRGDALVRQQALGAPAVDTTGVGSVFHGAFAYGLARELSFERTLELASAVAGLSAQARGARAGLPTLSQVTRLLPWLKA